MSLWFCSRCLGTLLAVVTHTGTVSACSLIDIGTHFIAVGFSSSLSVLSNFLSSLRFRAASCSFVLTDSTPGPVVRTMPPALCWRASLAPKRLTRLGGTPYQKKYAGMTSNLCRSLQLISIVSFSSLLTATCSATCTVYVHTCIFGITIHMHAASCNIVELHYFRPVNVYAVL